MKVFISWSGAISHKVAIVLRDWLPHVIQSIEPYVSSEDIDKGARWSTDISEELEKSSFGIICVTKDNVDARWLNFEAGTLSRSVRKGRVAPFLFEVELSEITKSPLSQFQATTFKKDDVKKLLDSLNTAGDAPLLREDRLKTAFDTYWPELENKLNEIQVSEPEAKEGAPSSQGEHADTSPQTVQQHVESLVSGVSQPHPLSTEAAVESLKQNLLDPRRRIQLTDLVNGTVGQIIETTSGENFDVGSPRPTKEALAARAQVYEETCSTLLAMAAIGGYQAEEEHVLMWQKALRRLGSRDSGLGKFYDEWCRLQQYPAALLLYALGLGAVEAGHLRFLERLLATELNPGHHQEAFAARELALPLGYFSWFYPAIIDRIDTTLRPHAAERISLEGDRYTFIFEKLDILTALNIAHCSGGSFESREWYWKNVAAYSYRHRPAIRGRIIQEIEESLNTREDASPFVTCNLFGKTKEQCQQGVLALKRILER